MPQTNHLDDSISDDPISDDELTALALAADPTAILDPNAHPWTGYEDSGPAAMPTWYMPRPTAVAARPLTRALVIALVLGFLTLEALGLCVTSGFVSLA
jgi:hypothetical protein